MRKILMEVCCGSADDVVQAQKGGANRVELNSCLFHGGLTPSVGELIAAKEAADLPIMAMARRAQCRDGQICRAGVFRNGIARRPGGACLFSPSQTRSARARSSATAAASVMA